MGHGGHHHGGHHGGGGRRRRAFGGRLGGVDVVDYLPEAIELDCYWERLPDGRMVRRCPPRVAEAMGPGAAYCRYSESMGAGDILPTFVTPSDAIAAINQTDSGYQSLNQAIQSSPNLQPSFQASWAIQFASWLAFSGPAKASVGILNTTAVMQQNDKFQQQLVDWTGSFKAMGGAISGPAPLPPGQAAPGEASLSSLLSGSTGLILAGAALAGVLLFGRMTK
jgi:hypothetical protein